MFELPADLLDRPTAHIKLAAHPRDRVHALHPLPPVQNHRTGTAALQRTGGQFWTPIPHAHGVNIPRRSTTTGLIALGTGAIAFHKATPSAIALGPVIAGSIAQGAAVSSFPLGATAGGIWYGLFPVQAAPFLVAGATAGVLGVAAVATAFAGMVSNPVQRALGLHHRRLNRFVDRDSSDFPVLGCCTSSFRTAPILASIAASTRSVLAAGRSPRQTGEPAAG